jgi:hypothetical protein
LTPLQRVTGNPQPIRLRTGASLGVPLPAAFWLGRPTYPADFSPQLRHPQGFLTLTGLYFLPNRRGLVSSRNALGIPPSAPFPRADKDPLPEPFPSCRYFLPRFRSEEKEAKKVVRLQGFNPRAGPYALNMLAHAKAPMRSWGFAPLAFSPPMSGRRSATLLRLAQHASRVGEQRCVSGHCRTRDWLRSLERADAYGVSNLPASRNEEPRAARAMCSP